VPCDAGLDLDTFTPFPRRGEGVTFLHDAGHGSVEDMENLLVVLDAFGRLSRETRDKARLLVRTWAPCNRYP
jgi:hypothetical protein